MAALENVVSDFYSSAFNLTFTPGSHSVFERNPDYWESGKPYVDRLVVDSSFTDNNSVFNALLSGSINLDYFKAPNTLLLDFLDQWCGGPARRALLRVEIDQHGSFRMQHFEIELCGINLLHAR